MGSTGTTVTISVDRAEQLRTERARTPWGGYKAFGAKLVDEAIAQWSEGKDPRDSAHVESLQLHSPLSGDVRDYGIDWDAEPAYAAHIFPIAEAGSVTTVTQILKLTVPGHLLPALRAGRGEYELRGLLEDQFPACTLGDVAVTYLPKATKPAAKATDGKAVTRYCLRAVTPVLVHLPDSQRALNATYSSQSEARSAAMSLLTEHPALPDLDVDAVVVRQREDGSLSKALVTVTRPVPEWEKIAVRVTTHTVKPNPVIDRYEVSFGFHY